MLNKEHFVKYVCETPSELGLEVAELLDRLVGGFHRIEPDLRGKVDWTHTHHIVIPLPQHFPLHTVDADLLTRLVVFSHDYCLRVEVNPRHFRWLELVFHKRERGDGFYEIPTLEKHVESIRRGGLTITA